MFRTGRWRSGTCTRRPTSASVACSSDTAPLSTSSILTDVTSCRRRATGPSKCGTCRRASSCARSTDTSAALRVCSTATLWWCLAAPTTPSGQWLLPRRGHSLLSYLCCCDSIISPGLVNCVVVMLLLGRYSIPCRTICWEACLQNDLFCVRWNVKP